MMSDPTQILKILEPSIFSIILLLSDSMITGVGEKDFAIRTAKRIALASANIELG